MELPVNRGLSSPIKAHNAHPQLSPCHLHSFLSYFSCLFICLVTFVLFLINLAENTLVTQCGWLGDITCEIWTRRSHSCRQTTGLIASVMYQAGRGCFTRSYRPNNDLLPCLFRALNCVLLFSGYVCYLLLQGVVVQVQLNRCPFNNLISCEIMRHCPRQLVIDIGLIEG